MKRWITVLVVVVALVAALPYVGSLFFKSWVIDQLKFQDKKLVAIERLLIHPFSARVDILNLTYTDEAEGRTFVKQASFDFDVLALFEKRVVLDHVTVEGVGLKVKWFDHSINVGGASLNLDQWFLPRSVPSWLVFDESWRFEIRDWRWESVDFHFQDHRTTGKHTWPSQIHVLIHDLSLADFNSWGEKPFAQWEINGSIKQWLQSNQQFSTDVKGSGDLELEYHPTKGVHGNTLAEVSFQNVQYQPSDLVWKLENVRWKGDWSLNVQSLSLADWLEQATYKLLGEFKVSGAHIYAEKDLSRPLLAISDIQLKKFSWTPSVFKAPIVEIHGGELLPVWQETGDAFHPDNQAGVTFDALQEFAATVEGFSVDNSQEKSHLELDNVIVSSGKAMIQHSNRPEKMPQTLNSEEKDSLNPETSIDTATEEIEQNEMIASSWPQLKPLEGLQGYDDIQDVWDNLTLSIGQVDLHPGVRITFLDDQYTPPFKQQLDVEQLIIGSYDSRQPEKKSKLELMGLINHESTIKLEGQVAISESSPSFNLDLQLDNYDISQLKSLSQKELGISLEEGHMNVNGQWVFKNEVFKLHNQLHLDHLQWTLNSEDEHANQTVNASNKVDQLNDELKDGNKLKDNNKRKDSSKSSKSEVLASAMALLPVIKNQQEQLAVVLPIEMPDSVGETQDEISLNEEVTYPEMISDALISAVVSQTAEHLQQRLEPFNSEIKVLSKEQYAQYHIQLMTVEMKSGNAEWSPGALDYVKTLGAWLKDKDDVSVYLCGVVSKREQSSLGSNSKIESLVQSREQRLREQMEKQFNISSQLLECEQEVLPTAHQSPGVALFL